MTFTRSKKFYYILAGIFLCSSAIIYKGYTTSPPSLTVLKKQTFSELSQIRCKKKQEVLDYFHEIMGVAEGLKEDQDMLSYFTAIKQRNSDQNLEYEIDKRYVKEYGNFYDILFVDLNGFVFHSIKKESDYHQNLFSPELQNQKITQLLQNPKKSTFAEFTYYRPSKEAAAFIPIPVEKNQQKIGWFILQFDTNHINAILTERKGLGRTGEIYLVNKEKFMLSDSRFTEDSTILRKKIDTIAVKEAFQKKTGNRIIHDYRGVEVFSSYESFNVLGSTWGIIAEIDESEIITDYYQKNKGYLQEQIIQYLALPSIHSSSLSRPIISETKQVNINEYARAGKDMLLVTRGVATCTAISIMYPENFSYLVHISPTDEIYLHSPLSKFILRKKYHNFLKELLGKIKFYEIYPYELAKLSFLIVAPHTNSFAKTVDALLAQGVDLGQIKFAYNPEARSANVMVSAVDNNAWVQWNEAKSVITEDSLALEDLGEIVKKIIGA